MNKDPQKMEPAAYIEGRVLDQFRYYDAKATTFKRWFHRLRVAEIFAAALIPFVTALINIGEDGSVFWSIVTGLLGVTVTIIASIIALTKIQEQWISYRATAERLKRRLFLYETRTHPYDADGPFHRFVGDIESILADENRDWEASVRSTDAAGVDPADAEDPD